MDNGTSVVKYLLLTVNIIVVAVTIWGIVPLVKILTNIGNIESEFPVIEIALIILGAITVFTSILGCCGATFNSIWFTKRYAAIILIHMIWQLTLFILILTNNEHFSKLLGTAIDRAWKHLDIDSFEVIQELFKCCGMNSSTDYTEKKVSIPASCYNGSPISTNLYKGCHGKSIEYLMDTTKEYQFMIIGLIVIELILFIFSCCFANNLGIYRNHKKLVLRTTSSKSVPPTTTSESVPPTTTPESVPLPTTTESVPAITTLKSEKDSTFAGRPIHLNINLKNDV